MFRNGRLHTLSRRDFLKVAGTVTGSALLAACAPEIRKLVETPTSSAVPSQIPTALTELTPTPKAETLHTAQEYQTVLTTYDTSTWPEWAKIVVEQKGLDAAVTQLAIEQLKAAGVVIDPETMTPTEFFDAYVHLNEGKIGYLPEEWSLATINDKENYLVLVHAVQTPSGIVGQGWNHGGGETQEMREQFASEENRNFTTPDGRQLIMRPFFVGAGAVLGEGAFGIFQPDILPQKSIDFVVKMENDGQSTYALLRLNFQEYVTSQQDICLPLGGGLALQSCAPGLSLGKPFDPETNMPILPGSQWFSSKSNLTLEEVQQKLQEGNFYAQFNTTLVVSNGGTFMIGFVYPITPSTPAQ